MEKCDQQKPPVFTVLQPDQPQITQTVTTDHVITRTASPGFPCHTDMKTTEVYERVDTEMKHRALESASKGIVTETLPAW